MKKSRIVVKGRLIIGLLFLCASFAQAQFQDEEERNPIKLSGKVIDADTKELVEGAKIKYESLPYGSKIGVFSGNEFSFTMEGGHDYMLVVNAEGYTMHSSTVKASENVNDSINKVIELIPNGLNRLIRLEKLIFALGKATITKESYSELDQVVSMLNGSETMTIQLEGHTDFRGNAKLNMDLSKDRVEAVKDYMVSKGIAKNRIKTKAFGGTEPLTKASDAASRAANRRVEVRILTN